MPPIIKFHGRRAVQVENRVLRLTFTVEGGHLAELLHKDAGVSPLWIPPWPSIEPSDYALSRHPEYGSDAESKLLAGIMGHNLCLDQFGPPSPEEAAAGLTVHGEANVVTHEFVSVPDGLKGKCLLPKAQLSFEREVHLDGNRVQIRETVENLSPFDRPIAWQQHVTLGPPFLEKGVSEFRAPVVRAAALEGERAFDWPWFVDAEGNRRDLRTYTSADASSGFTTQLLDATKTNSYALAFSRGLLLGYVWETADFPWLGMWEENCLRPSPPWNSRTQTLGLEFGASPFPEPRRKMITRGSLFGTPTFRWLPGRSAVSVTYYAALVPAARIPESLEGFEAKLQ